MGRFQADLLVQFAKQRIAGRFAVVDAALGNCQALWPTRLAQNTRPSASQITMPTLGRYPLASMMSTAMGGHSGHGENRPVLFHSCPRHQSTLVKRLASAARGRDNGRPSGEHPT